MSRRRRSPRPLRFNLTQKERNYERGSSVAILVGGGIFCVALVLFFKEPEPHATTTYPRPHAAAPSAIAGAAPDNTPAAAEQRPISRAAAPYQARFSLCGKVRHDCVVDGDTFWAQGEKIRIADIDTPEISRSRCHEERALGIRATTRLLELLNQGPFELVQPSDGRDRDRYGRALRHVERDGVSIGDRLVTEGLARKWEGRREPWC